MLPSLFYTRGYLISFPGEVHVRSVDLVRSIGRCHLMHGRFTQRAPLSHLQSSSSFSSFCKVKESFISLARHSGLRSSMARHPGLWCGRRRAFRRGGHGGLVDQHSGRGTRAGVARWLQRQAPASTSTGNQANKPRHGVFMVVASVAGSGARVCMCT
jgi:hypothetical protein